MQTPTNQNGRAKRGKQDQQDVDRAAGEGMSKSTHDNPSSDAAEFSRLLGIRSLDDVKEYVATLQERARRQVQLRPLATVGTAVGIGLGVGLLLRRGLLGAILATAAGLAFRQLRS